MCQSLSSSASVCLSTACSRVRSASSVIYSAASGPYVLAWVSHLVFFLCRKKELRLVFSNCLTAKHLDDLTDYRGAPDPIHGDAIYRQIREESQVEETEWSISVVLTFLHNFYIQELMNALFDTDDGVRQRPEGMESPGSMISATATSISGFMPGFGMGMPPHALIHQYNPNLTSHIRIR